MTLNWGLVREFGAACAAVNVAPPPSVRRGLELLDIAHAHAADPVGPPLLGLSDDELRDRVTALAVRQHDRDGRPSERGMLPGIELIEQELAAEVREAVLPELDALITSLQPRFDEAARPLEVAAKDFGIESMTSTDDLLDRADFAEAGAAWRDMRRAWSKLQPIVSWRVKVCQTFLLAPTPDQTRAAGHVVLSDSDVNWSILFASGEGWSLDPDAYRVGRDRRADLDWLQLARDGLSLNTVTRVAAKVAARGRPALADVHAAAET